jgi:Asp-tRNA(Asn)/Glu-tRNA(Gln) amidotransferase A subunit family amidase
MSDSIRDFTEYTITEFHKELLQGMVTSEELTQWYIERIDALNEQGPELHAVVTINPAAIEQARATDEHFAATGELLGPLHGVPILVKDQAETAGLRTTFGSALFKAYIPEKDSGIAEKIKAAGAIIVAKAAMNDLACGYSGHSTITYETKNPYDLARDPGGSSAGTGSGIAANLALVGIGEDTGGSIRVPSSFNNLFGLRVTAGLITRRGLQGLVPVQDTPGPMARTVTDLVTLLDVLAGYDPEDPLTEIAVGSSHVGRFSELLASLPAWSDLRIGVLESAFISGSHQEDAVVETLVRSAIGKIKDQGARVTEGLKIDDLLGWYEKTSLYEWVSRRTLEDFFASHGAPVKDYDEFIEKGYYNPVLSTFLAIKDGSQDPAHDLGYTAGLLRQREFREIVLNLMAKNDVDILIYPTVRELPPKLTDVRDGFDVAGFPTNTIIGSQAVLPAMSIPVGFSPEGVPVGMEILARPLQENRLIQLAALWEKLSAPRTAPKL